MSNNGRPYTYRIQDGCRNCKHCKKLEPQWSQATVCIAYAEPAEWTWAQVNEQSVEAHGICILHELKSNL